MTALSGSEDAGQTCEKAILSRMAKRGYNVDTIRGGASDWDVSRPFSSYLRTLATLVVHPARFFEVLPRVPDPRAPGLFLVFCGFPSAVLWFAFGGLYPALIALFAPLPLSLVLAALYHLGSLGGRYGYVVTWRVAAYPMGFCLPLTAVPVARWAALIYFGALLIPLGLHKVQEIPAWRGLLVSFAIAALIFGAYHRLVG